VLSWFLWRIVVIFLERNKNFRWEKSKRFDYGLEVDVGEATTSIFVCLCLSSLMMGKNMFFFLLIASWMRILVICEEWFLFAGSSLYNSRQKLGFYTLAEWLLGASRRIIIFIIIWAPFDLLSSLPLPLLLLPLMCIMQNCSLHCAELNPALSRTQLCDCDLIVEFKTIFVALEFIIDCLLIQLCDYNLAVLFRSLSLVICVFMDD